MLLLAVSLLVGITWCDVIQKYDFQDDGSGNYSLDVRTGDKGVLTSLHKQQGHLERKNANNASLHVDGQVLYKVDDSLWMSVNYTADEHGYRPIVKWVFVPKSEDNETILDLRGPDQKKGISTTVLETLIGGHSG